MKKRIISLVMVLVLVFTMLPVYAMADETGSGDVGSASSASVDISAIVEQIKSLISDGGDVSAQLESILAGLNTEQITELLKKLVESNETIGSIGAVIGEIDPEQIAAIVGMISGGGLGDINVEEILSKLDTEQIAALLQALIGDNADLGDIGAIIEQLPAEDIADAIKSLIAGDADISAILSKLDPDVIAAVIGSLVGDNETIGQIIDMIPMDTLVEVVKALIAGDADISGILENLDTTELIALLQGLIGTDTDIGAIIDNLDMEQIIALVKALISGEGGDINIGDIVGELDPYELVQLIAGLVGSDLDVTDPSNVTVTEGETATFSVKINRSNIMGIPTDSTDYKYLWLEPAAIRSLDFSSVDFSSYATAALQIIMKLGAHALSTTDTLNIADTTMKDDGRSFACLIYNLSLDGSTMHLTDSATLTVTALSNCKHDKVTKVSGIDATCTEDGCLAYYECTTCHKLFLDQSCTKQTNAKDVVIPATGHEETTVKAAVEPTCTKDGMTAEIKCANCGETLQKQTTVPAKGHTKVVDTEAIEATCTTGGRTEGSHCSVCKEVLSVSEPVKATGHNFGNDIQCANCGLYLPFPFVDVPATEWYRTDVEYVWQNRLMNGMSATTFEPGTNMTREMFVTVLYRLSGAKYDGSWTSPFTDLVSNWSYEAIMWAYNNGITNGKGPSIFDPTAPISRAEIVTMLYRFTGSPATGGALSFTDASSVQFWAYSAVLWASNNGIVIGYNDGSFGPDKTAVRSEMAAMLHRYCTTIL